MKTMRSSLRPLGLAVLPIACAPWPEWPADECSDEACDATTGTSSGGGGFTTGTVTTAVASSSASGSSSGTEGDEATTGEEALPPRIVEVALTPDPIKKNGAIAVSVVTELAEGVRMVVDDGEAIELVAGDVAGTFVGEIAVLTGLWNGPHIAAFTAWQGDLEGEVVQRGYEFPASGGFIPPGMPAHSPDIALPPIGLGRTDLRPRAVLLGLELLLLLLQILDPLFFLLPLALGFLGLALVRNGAA